MKTIPRMTVLLACALFAGACSRSEKAQLVVAQTTPEPTIAVVQATPAQMSEAEFEAERQRLLAARAEADRLRTLPTPSTQSDASAPIITANDPGPGPSGLVPSTNLEQKDPITGPVSGTAVEVVSVSGKVIAAELKTNGKGGISVQLPAAGTYLVRYTSGPLKGKTIRTITATEAGSVIVSIPAPPAAP
jgi:uncharacterized surface anchored protein